MPPAILGFSPILIVLLTLLLPLASAATIALFLRRQGAIAAIVATFTAAIVAAGSLALAFGGSRFIGTVPWLQLGDFGLSLGVKFDDLAALMLAIVGVVGLCVHVFSLGYMRDDASKARYFGGLSIFMFSMIGIVLADNLFMLFVFWELVGFSSYVLINHYHERTAAADAAKKAFITNRIGDFGFLIGIIFCYHAFGTVNLSELAVIGDSGISANMIAALLFCGAIGKSAQVPLHVWLPDAMEGPTPVSALIHAATMVAAGIFMLCRLEPIFAAAPLALQVVTWIGTGTALYAALCAITQSDIKKVLAYSTLSQLGYMVAAFGLGRLEIVPKTETGSLVLINAGAAAAMFHLTTHAFFKALLFLGAGSVINGCHHEQNIFKMGGLSTRMKWTFATFTIGVAAIIGVPALAGFFSKDAILYLAYENNRAVFVILALTAILTAFYMVRLWRLVFFGAPRSEAASHAHEGGISLVVPLLVLAVLSIVGGYTQFYGTTFAEFWKSVPEAHGAAHVVVLVVSLAVMAIGGGLALIIYKPADTDALAIRSPVLFTALTAIRGVFDSVYNGYITRIQRPFASILDFADRILLSGFIIRGASAMVGLVGIGARALHVGSLHAYVYWFLAGAALLWAFAGGWFN